MKQRNTPDIIRSDETRQTYHIFIDPPHPSEDWLYISKITYERDLNIPGETLEIRFCDGGIGDIYLGEWPDGYKATYSEDKCENLPLSKRLGEMNPKIRKRVLNALSLEARILIEMFLKKVVFPSYEKKDKLIPTPS